jgi:hypothetical protein
MDCKTVRLLLDFARPHAPEVEPADAEALDRHLAGCAACAALAADERRLDDVLGRAMRQVAVPDHFRQQLLNRLEAERAAWYRRWYGHALRAALAASLLVAAVWGALVWRSRHLPEPRLDSLQEEVALRDINGYTKDAVAEAYRQQGFETVVPPHLNYKYLAAPPLFREYQKERVPYLVFSYTLLHKQSEGASARAEPGTVVEVLVLSDKQFDLNKLKEGVQEGREGYGRTFFIEKHPSGHYAYLYIYTGNSLDWVRT